MSQTSQINARIIALIDMGFSEKSAIYTEIIKQMGVPRSTIRRAASQLAVDVAKWHKVLSSKGQSQNRSSNI